MLDTHIYILYPQICCLYTCFYIELYVAHIYIYIYIYIYISLRKTKIGHIRIINLFHPVMCIDKYQ